ncbi:Protein of unknown function [Jatrophihabitans endophyticus]|uniref:DUF3043 domain-containing protein n=1 Tax=Jatrophihabitans endophyticus TaxID=1206085 RepID=A0A1M5L0A8_9ACTN|nr:DUF3043 domain-containing protein [Jatrophihabitans endophyticus]SHG58426.1 Protein of unknown function [Jatrophihabitans endophyticus]
MKLSRRDKSAADAEAAAEPVVLDKSAVGGAAGKGRPTPKRRDSQGRRGPVSAPKTRKEAYARQKEQAREQRAAAKTAKPRTVAEQRAALKRGDPAVLPKRDQGRTRKLARDWVDSRRMFSNYLLILFPLLVITALVPALAILQAVVLALLLGLIVEWYLTGRRIRTLARERYGSADGGNMSIGFYAGSRAYLPRKWRLPGPQVERGDEI